MYIEGHGRASSRLFQCIVSILLMLIFGCEYVRLLFGKNIKNVFTDVVDIIISWA
jgi:hypothetical protein